MAPRTRGAIDEASDDEPAGENAFLQFAKAHWLKPTTTKKQPSKVKVKQDELKEEIWDVLEAEDFQFQPLLLLENLQMLER